MKVRVIHLKGMRGKSITKYSLNIKLFKSARYLYKKVLN
jgi:hypothetical protein